MEGLAYAQQLLEWSALLNTERITLEEFLERKEREELPQKITHPSLKEA